MHYRVAFGPSREQASAKPVHNNSSAGNLCYVQNMFIIMQINKHVYHLYNN